MKIKTLKTKTEKEKMKTEISIEKQNGEVKIKTFKTKTKSLSGPRAFCSFYLSYASLLNKIRFNNYNDS